MSNTFSYSWLILEDVTSRVVLDLNVLLKQLSPKRTSLLTKTELLLGLRHSSAFICVARNKDGRIVGTATLNEKWIMAYGLIGWIDDVVVDNKFRNRGIAHELMRRLEARALVDDVLFTNLTTNREQARAMYENMGYSVIETSSMAKWINWKEQLRERDE